MTAAAELLTQYVWKTSSAFDQTQLSILLLAAQDLLNFSEEALPGGGLAWLRRWLSPVNFHIGGLPQMLVSRNASHNMSVVFPLRDVWLSADFPALPNPRQHIVHELAHVLDNSQAARSVPATFFGGGPADRLVRALGGLPRGLRFSNGSCSIPTVNQWSAAAGGGYGNRASAEYFAEALAWSVYHPPQLPTPAIASWLKVNVFLAVA